jgi:extracellular solute-binding protein family 1
MKLANRIGAAVLATAMVGTLLTGCGGGSASTTASTGDGTAAASSTESSGDGDNTYTMFMRSTYVDWIKELKWYDVAEERTGIHVDYISGPEEFNDVYSEIDQRVISGDLPDAVMTKLVQTSVYGPQGVFADLAPYIEKYAPNLQKYIDDNPDYKALVTDKAGHIYGLCKETPIFADLIGYRVDQFKAAGIDPDSIVTIDDFTKALETLKAYYGKDNPNYYPLTGRDTAIRFASWFGAASNISSTESNGIYINGHYKDGSIDIMSDGAYKMVETMKKWYDEGLIQPEWVAGTFGEADWEAAMLNGNGSVFYDYYNRAEWFMENGGPGNDPNYQMGVLNFIKDDNGNPQKMTVSMKYNDECVTAVNANCSEDKIKTILTFIDYFYSEEGEILANYGVEGESFKTDANGDKEFIADYQTEEATPAGEKRWSFLSDRFTVCKPVDNEAFFKWNAPLIAEATGRLFTDENLGTSYVLKFTDDQSKEVTNLLASVYDAQMSGIAQFIDGTRELTPDNWAAFQQEMNDLGLSRIEEIQLAAYQAMYGA